jgi:signal transduction histidine kinase
MMHEVMDRTFKRFIGKHMLLIGFLAVLVPLGILLGMQYKWLTSLAETSAIAEKTWLNNYLEAVSSEVEYFYRKQAERGLNIPQVYITSNRPEKVGHYFKKKSIEGVKYLFVAKFPQGKDKDWGKLITYDAIRNKLARPNDAETTRAISVALAPWKTLAYRGDAVQSHAISVDERDPENRIILNPISDDGCRIVAVAGMVIDNDYFKNEVLQVAIKKSLPHFFDERSQENLIITVRDGKGKLVWGSEKHLEDGSQEQARIPFIFSDWELALGSRDTTPEEWAESNFLLNISMSILLAVVLLGGIVLALRTASREIHFSQMKSDFVSNVSHELRTPLASIRVFGEFLRLGRVRQPEKIREYGEYIETESSRLTQLINNILDFSKIESGAKTYNFEPTDVAEVVCDTLRTLEVSLRHKGFSIRQEQQDSPLPVLNLDADSVAQALANLIDNAVKYSDGATEIDVTLSRRGDSVIIAVTDGGIGISRDAQKKIFDRFHRVGTGLVHDVKGSGLGLSIVDHIVKAHGGKVTVESEPGRGSTFKIHLPAEPSLPRAEPLAVSSPADSVRQVGSG